MDFPVVIQEINGFPFKMPAFDEHGARAHLSHDACGLAHSIFILDSKPRDAFGFTTWPRLMHAEGLLTDDDVARWEADVDAAVADGEFLYAVTFFITSGSKP